MYVKVTYEKGEIFLEGIGPHSAIGMVTDVLLGTRYGQHGDIKKIEVAPDLDTLINRVEKAGATV